ncbi:MAG: VCBS repeat-containing protein, partial [Planctomycetota bacterium]
MAALFFAASALVAQEDGSLARYFGFDEKRVVVIDDGFGPTITADMNNDGLADIIAVNNRKSRIEVHVQRTTPLTDAELDQELAANKLPDSKYYKRNNVSVSHRVQAVRAFDVNGDGQLDLVYAGTPGTIAVLEQTGSSADTLRFESTVERRVRGLSSSDYSFEIADVQGDPRPELLAMASGKIEIYDLNTDGAVGEPKKVGSSDGMFGFFVEDFNGDGANDLLAVSPESESPISLWLRRDDNTLGPERRFEMPTLIEAEPIRFADRPAASLAVIERSSRRFVLFDLATEMVVTDLSEGAAVRGRDVSAEVFPFQGGGDRDRAVVISDLDGDGYDDLIAADKEANSIVVHLQKQGRNGGLGEGISFSAFKEPKDIAHGDWGGESAVFVLSEEEKTVGVSTWSGSRLSFPQPLQIQTAGSSPVAMGYLHPEDAMGHRRVSMQAQLPFVGIVVRDGRDHALELHRVDNEVRVIELAGVKRPPESMLAGDFNADGILDVVLFTPSEPMVMVEGVARAFDGEDAKDPVVLTNDDMPQFGLVEAAGSNNTALLDADGDGMLELLIADENFVRAAAYDTDKGWRVVDQITMPDPRAALVGLTVLQDGSSLGASGPVIVAADSTNTELLMIRKDASGVWDVADRLILSGVELGQIEAGAFAGDKEPSILAITPEAFATVRLAGEMVSLEEFAAYRSDEESRFEHEIEAGDINSDGFVDLVVLDAREQMLQVFTLSASRNLLFAMEFEVF